MPMHSGGKVQKVGLEYFIHILKTQDEECGLSLRSNRNQEIILDTVNLKVQVHRLID